MYPVTKDNLYSNYTQLLEKVDQAFRAIYSRNTEMFACRAGCFSCCRGDLSVLEVEAQYIRYWLQNNPEVRSALGDNHTMMNDAAHCGFLDKEGRCVIYEARPVVCRSHGAPISWSDTGESRSTTRDSRDVCPLNFQGVDVYDLAAQDVISLDKLNTLLSLINRHFTQADDAERVPLRKICSRAGGEDQGAMLSSE